MSDAETGPRGPALVSGASSGIGRAFAENLALRGHPVVAVARRAERLTELVEWAANRGLPTVTPVVADLTTKSGLKAVRRAVEAWDAPAEVVVLNAGYGSRGRLDGLDRRREADMVRLNCVAVVDLAGLLLPAMVAARRGALVVVSSAAAYQPIPHMATYAATKAFEEHWLRALHEELAGSGVRTVAVCPGPTSTEFSTAAGSRVRLPAIAYEQPETVVRAAWRALAADRPSVSVGVVARVAQAAGWILPLPLRTRVAGRIHRTTRPVPRQLDSGRIPPPVDPPR